MQSNEVETLINRVAIGDRQAFALLYRVTSPKLFSICLRILRDRAEAEEALQEIYIKIWQRAKTFAVGAGSPSSWLASIARNHSIDTIRSRKPVAEDIADQYDLVDETVASPEQQVVIIDEGRRIAHCMEQLDASHARAVRRAYVEGLSYLELADELQAPINTVRTWLRRSLMKLRECMER
ncbi:sigma-70 family RNA polymerase sigma factor [Rhizobium deserti]|uniref:Sigma-70 family RNA polymerase sigma factor n=1 Tax=Rhizobium deserti TaxID=2547961 RepID=A0A4R5UIJ0_9HYPH|nr:sigma-70 family RNA polymerase sigma factor [Rhizobium deserti]TDK36616.1 sigma-70 family RNA polymerase sigma factor [Rhizobium deserti]